MHKLSILSVLVIASPILMVGCGADGGSAFTMLTKPGSLNATADAEGYREGDVGFPGADPNSSPDLNPQGELDEGGSRLGQSEDDIFDEMSGDAENSAPVLVTLTNPESAGDGTPDGVDENGGGEPGRPDPVGVVFNGNGSSSGGSSAGASTNGQSATRAPALLGSCGEGSVDSDLSVSSSSLWPPNGNMVPVSIIGEKSAGCFITDVSDNETNLSEDAVITGDLSVDLRARRQGSNMQGRIYSIALQCSNDADGVTFPTLEVRVCHDNRRR